MIRCSVLGIATGASPDPDARLRDLLVTGITAARRTSAPAPSAVQPQRA